MNNRKLDTAQGHWLLAKMGKKVLRPGGRELTMALMEKMDITGEDDVVEFAPGLGYTASIALENHPRSYKGVELNEEAAAILRRKIKGPGREIIVGNAAHSSLVANCATKVYGEAMLTMHADHRKAEIVQEAHRILVCGGCYGIHELGLHPDHLDPELKKRIQRELAQVIHVNARPLTVSEWSAIMEKEGFGVREVMTNPMHLLEVQRMVADEGVWQALRIGWNVLRHPQARKRILAMRSVFRKYGDYMHAIAIVAEKL